MSKKNSASSQSLWSSQTSNSDKRKENSKNNGSNQSMDPEVEFEVPDIHAMRLKINTLGSERAFLIRENESLKKNLDEVCNIEVFQYLQNT